MERYGIQGQLIGKDDQSIVLAERTGETCQIRIGPHNRLFRPLIDETHELTMINKRTGRSVFPMYKCSIKCLESYVEFLKSGSTTFLHAAEREL